MEQGRKNLDEPDLRRSEPAAPLPCANGCGFYGSPDDRGLCSKCFRDSLRRAEAQGPPTASSSALASAEPDAATATSKEPEEGTRRAAKTGSRCAACGRKVALMGFQCRCGGVFCGEHRYSDRHDCGYDYRGHAHDAIARANPVVRADKVDKVDKL